MSYERQVTIRIKNQNVLAKIAKLRFAQFPDDLQKPTISAYIRWLVEKDIDKELKSIAKRRGE
jgi:hypothetical protein